jgi:peptide/nickel transport system substrate-binding protein
MHTLFRRHLLQRSAALLATGAASSLGLASASTSHSPSHSPSHSRSSAFADRSERALRIVGPWEISGLEPATSGYFFTRLEVCETLVEADDHGRLLPGLAAQWIVSDDGLRWQFDIRRGAQFHDGSAVTSAIVALSIERAFKRPGVLRLAPIKTITATNTSVVVTLDAPFAQLPALLAHSSTMILAKASFSSDLAKVNSIIGSGPYRVERLHMPAQLDVVALNADQPILRATYLNASRSETRAIMAESGQVELAFALDPASLARLRRVGPIQISQVTVPRTMILKVNCGHKWLSDVRARQALSLAINRAGIARGLLRDADLAATQLLPPTLQAWHDRTLAPLRFDPSVAITLWQQMGWQRGADGLLRKDGQTFRMSLRTFPDRPELPLVAAAIQEQLRQTGIDCAVLIGNSGDIPLRHRDGSLELGLAARHYGLTPDPLGTLMQDFSNGGSDWGAMNWQPSSLPALFKSLASTPNVASHREALINLLHNELPVIPIAWYRQTAAIAKSVQGLTLDPLERSWRISSIR